MNPGKEALFNKLVDLEQKLSGTELHYWIKYSDFHSWEFWINVVMLIVPLIILIILIDRKHIFLLGFYGMNIDAWFTYLNLIGVRCGLWDYPNRLAPILPFFSFSASFIPVIYILVYQWTIKKEKNFYLYTLIASVLISFIVMPIFVVSHFFEMFKWINYGWLLVFILIVCLWSKIITNIFIYLNKKSEQYE
jgi:hypothetical protein